MTAIEALKLAGQELRLVQFTYHAKTRTVEPYSFRRGKDGQLLLCAFQVSPVDPGRSPPHTKSFEVAQILGLTVLSETFSPRWPVELR